MALGSVACTSADPADLEVTQEAPLTPDAGDEVAIDAGAQAAVPEGPCVPSSDTPPLSDAAARWVGTWATGPQLTEPNNLPPPPGLAGNTLRQNLFTTLDGDRVRLLFSNEWGESPLTFQSVRIASSVRGSQIEAATDTAVRFGGQRCVTIPARETRWSDPLDFGVTALTSVTVSIHLDGAPANVTGHPGSRTTSYILGGDAVSEEVFVGPASTDHWYFVTGIDADAAEPSASIVTLGDSITDGRGSTTNANNRWPDNLARRLKADPATASLSVLNQGIGGNAVLNGGLGPTATQRFERDVLEQRGVRWVIVLEGVNDIGFSADASVADRLIEAYDGLIDSAHERGLLIYGVPILPFGGSMYDSPAHEEARQAVNEWIRTSGRFDAVIHLDVAVADPDDPARLLPAYDSGDQLHLSVAGYQAMADAIDLSLFQP